MKDPEDKTLFILIIITQLAGGDVMQLHVYLVPHGRNHPAGIYSLLPDSNHTCSHDVPRALKKKTNLAIRGVLHANTCALPVRNLRRALCEQNTPRRSRRVSHTCLRKEPVQSESNYPAWPLSVRGISYIHRVRFRTGPHPRSRARGGLVSLHGTDHPVAAV